MQASRSFVFWYLVIIGVRIEETTLSSVNLLQEFNHIACVIKGKLTVNKSQIEKNVIKIFLDWIKLRIARTCNIYFRKIILLILTICKIITYIVN